MNRGPYKIFPVYKSDRAQTWTNPYRHVQYRFRSPDTTANDKIIDTHATCDTHVRTIFGRRGRGRNSVGRKFVRGWLGSYWQTPYPATRRPFTALPSEGPHRGEVNFVVALRTGVCRRVAMVMPRWNLSSCRALGLRNLGDGERSSTNNCRGTISGWVA